MLSPRRGIISSLLSRRAIQTIWNAIAADTLLSRQRRRRVRSRRPRHANKIPRIITPTRRPRSWNPHTLLHGTLVGRRRWRQETSSSRFEREREATFHLIPCSAGAAVLVHRHSRLTALEKTPRIDRTRTTERHVTEEMEGWRESGERTREEVR